MIDISKREHLSPSEMIWIVKTSSNLGTDDAKAAAAGLIKKIIDKAYQRPGFRPSKSRRPNRPCNPWERQLLAEQGKYEKAQDLIEQLIANLSPQTRSAYLEGQDSHDVGRQGPVQIRQMPSPPGTTCGSGWSGVKPPPGMKLDPKYEVIYCEVDCLLKMAQKTNNKETAKTGMELLMPYLNLDEKIRNPSEEYKEISAKFFQLGDKVASYLSVPQARPPQAQADALQVNQAGGGRQAARRQVGGMDLRVRPLQTGRTRQYPTSPPRQSSARAYWPSTKPQGSPLPTQRNG